MQFYSRIHGSALNQIRGLIVKDKDNYTKRQLEIQEASLKLQEQTLAEKQASNAAKLKEKEQEAVVLAQTESNAFLGECTGCFGTGGKSLLCSIALIVQSFITLLARIHSPVFLI